MLISRTLYVHKALLLSDRPALESSMQEGNDSNGLS